MTRAALVLAITLAAAATASAQPPAVSADIPRQADPISCLSADTTPGAPVIPAPASALATPIPWTEFVVEGDLVDSPATVHAMLEPTLAQYRTNLSAKTLRENISKITAKLGYQLVAADTRDLPNGALLVLRLEPLPMVRKLVVDLPHQGILDKLLDEEVRRRMQVRVGSYLPSDPVRRQCLMIEERQRIETYLQDEGYFEASVTIIAVPDPRGSTVIVRVDLGPEYRVCKVDVPPPQSGEQLAVRTSDISGKFFHKQIRFFFFGFGSSRFTRSQHQDDLQKVKELFHNVGYPAARVQSSLNDPETLRASFDRNTKCVYVKLTIDPRRHVDIRFEGNNREQVTDEFLRHQLTFDQAGATDDVEAAASARAIAESLQKRGMFDVRVTWTRDRQPEFDKLVFHIDQGKGREVKSVEFVGNDKDPNHEFNDKILAGIVATKEVTTAGDILGTNTNATSPQLAADIDRIREYYRRAGYREAQVSVTASPGCTVGPPSCGTGDAAFAAALVEAGAGDDLYVRFAIEPGDRTHLGRVEIEPADAEAGKELAAGLCDQMLKELANELGAKELARRTDAAICTASQAMKPFREDDVAATRDRLREALIKLGRPRAEIEYEPRVIGAHLVEAHYKIRTVEPRRIGKILVRGAFRTDDALIIDELNLHEGELLSSDALADAARRLRVTNLFDAVNIDPVDLGSDSPYVNAIVRVEERYDYLAQIDLEGGYSSYNGLFGTATTKLSNLGGRGISASLTGTYGEKIKNLEGTLRFPQYLLRHWTHLEFQTELTGLYRQQDTPRFGLLTTEGATLAFSRVWPHPKTPTNPKASTKSLSLHYDYRLRTRNVDALRPIGADMDTSQVAISTTTGSIGISADLDGRVDRSGQLSPLAAAAGYHLGATVSIAAPVLFGQDTFAKASLSASKFIPVGENLTIRGDFRYDEGFPLGGAVLLPDVERFFAGGDNTVRGYQDDRLATEIVRVQVPPLGNVEQIRVIPAGGNIRLLSSLDAQYRIYSILAGAVFTDAGMITNQWSSVAESDIRPSVGTGLRVLSPFGIGALEYAVPIHPHIGDDPRGRIHFYFAARAQF